MRTSVGGSEIRLRISNVFGTKPLTLNDVRVALSGAGAAMAAGSSHRVTFGGRDTVTIPAGKREFSDPVGYLDLYGTAFGFRILPTLARVKPGFRLRINEDEVDDVFEVPLWFLMNPANHQIHAKEFRGIERSYYAMPFAERYIWGATAGILRALYERIYAP